MKTLYDEYERANGSCHYFLNPIGRAWSRPEAELKDLIVDPKSRSEGNVITCKISPEMRELMEKGIHYLDLADEDFEPDRKIRLR